MCPQLTKIIPRIGADNNLADYELLIGRDSSVGIATRYGLGGPEIESRWRTRFTATFYTCPGAQPDSPTMGTGALQGVKRPRVALTTHPICSRVNFPLVSHVYC